MPKQVYIFGVWSLPNIVDTKHEMLAVKDDVLFTLDHLTLAKTRNEAQFLTKAWSRQVSANIFRCFGSH